VKADKAAPVALDPVARAALRERAIGVLVDAASGPSPEVQANALEALVPAPARLEPLAVSALSSDNFGVRAVAAAAVGRARLNALAPNLEPLTRDSSPMVRASALYALERCGKLVDLTPLAVMLQDDSPRVRAQAAFLLGELGNTSAVLMLQEVAAEPDPRASPAQIRAMQLQIAEARVKLGDLDALQEIRAALYPAKSDDLEATALAAQIVGQVRDHVSINQLIALTSMRDDVNKLMPPEVRLAAAGALARMGKPQGSYIAIEYRTSTTATLRAQAAYVFGATGQAANLSYLDVMLGDPSWLVRVSAANGILRICESGAVGGAAVATDGAGGPGQARSGTP
jgi:HEAT repeat protein